MDQDDIVIRRAEAKDIPSVTEIFNVYVNNTIFTFNIVPLTDKQALETFETNTTRGFLYLVAVKKDTEEVIGYCYGGAFRRWNEAYKHTAEISIYIRPEHTGKKAGTRMLQKFIDILKSLKDDSTSVKDWFFTEPLYIKSIVACIGVDENPEKNRKIQHFQDHFGFKLVARFEQAGLKFGKWIDIVFLQLMIS